MKGGKRSPTPSTSIEQTPSKRSRVDAAILARIRQQEEKERLAHSAAHNAPGSSNVIVVDTEGDEALARRLALEWGEEQNQLSPDGVTSRKTHCTPDDDDEIQIVEIPKPQDLQTCSAPVTSSKCHEQRTSYTAELDPPDKRLSSFRDLFTGSRDCSKCKKPVAAPRGHVMFRSADSDLPPSVVHLLHAPCASCGTNHCRGCWSPISCTASCKGAPNKGVCTVATCCAASRAIAIFETLGGLDRQIIGERATSQSRAMALAKSKYRKSSASVGPGGTGYGTGSSYGRGSGRTQNFAAPKPSRAEGLAKHWDEIIIRAFNVLVALLPAPYSESAQAYDLVPHGSVGILLSLSKLPELLAILLRNDSLTDWTARSETYHAMLRLLRRMADCELTFQVLLEQRWEVADAPGLEPWMWGEGELVWQKDMDNLIERGPPLYEYFRKLIKQGETFMATVSHLVDGEEEAQETITQAISLCGDIIAAGADIERIMSIFGFCHAKANHNKGKKKQDSSFTIDKCYAAACDELAFKHVVLASQDKKGESAGLMYPNYFFAQNLDQTQNAVRNPKNHFRLASELAMLATSLPSGVWVRVDEVRNDAIKIMIAGPEGTPYEGGLFEFDCFMPLEYPKVPPLVHLRTTGGGTVRFNPNLYNCGKVCLSLLGTWPGRPEEQWSAQSTLLQVIISIQSMILIDAPYFNEPGHGKANLNASASIAYNRAVSSNTVRWAILDWMQDKHLNGLWTEVIVSHFSIKKGRIRERIIQQDIDEPLINPYKPGIAGPHVYTGLYDSVVYHTTGKRDPVAEYDKGMQRIDVLKGRISMGC